MTDNLKSAVTKSSKYEPVINEYFADFADHYSISVLPTRAYKPRDKSLVEGAVKNIYTRIYTKLRGRTFHTLNDLNQAIWAALEEHNNTLLRGRHYSRRMQFTEVEMPVLNALPPLKYEHKKQVFATVTDGYKIFGSTLMGDIIYTEDDRNELENLLKESPVPRTERKIRLMPSPVIKLSPEQFEQAERYGLSCSDIYEISSYNMPRKNNFKEKEKKEIQNTITINVNSNPRETKSTFFRILAVKIQKKVTPYTGRDV